MPDIPVDPLTENDLKSLVEVYTTLEGNFSEAVALSAVAEAVIALRVNEATSIAHMISRLATTQK